MGGFLRGRLLGLFVLLLAAWSCGPRQQVTVLITVSGLRSAAVASGAMPRLQKWSAGSLGEALTPVPETVPALSALMTGVDPEQSRIWFGGQARLSADTPTLAELFRRESFRTAAFVGHRDVTPLTGLARGFETWAGPVVGSAPSVTDKDPTQLFSAGGVRNASQIADQATRWLRDHSREPKLFLWLHLGDLQEAVLRGPDPRSAYHAALADVDSAIGLVLDGLMTYGLDKKARVLVASVHGLALGEGGETQSGLTAADSVVKVPVARTGRAFSQLGGRLWGLSDLFFELAPSGSPRPPREVYVAAVRLPERDFGWANQAVAVGAQGVLRMGPGPSWTPSGGGRSLEGLEAWRGAPEPFRERLMALGFHPEPSEPPIDPAALGLYGAAVGALNRQEWEKGRKMLEELSARLPAAPVPRAVHLRLIAFLPPSAQEQLRAAHEKTAQELEALAKGSAARQIVVARALAGGGAVEPARRLLRALAQDSALSSGELLAVTQGFVEAGADEESLGPMETLMKAEPGAFELTELSGDLLQRTGNAFRSRQAYEKALAGPTFNRVNLLAKLGDVLAGLNNQDDALKRYAEAVQADPGFLYAHARAADILLAKGQSDAAADALVKALQPTGSPADDALLRSQVLISRGLLRAAGIEITRGLQVAPDDIRLKVEWVRLLETAGKPDEARSAIQDVLKAHPNDPTALVEWAWIEAWAGRSQEAIAALNRAEAAAGPGLTERVRSEPLFQKGGPQSPLAQKAKAFMGRGGDSQPATGGVAPR